MISALLKEGEYTWEAYVEDEKRGTALFFVENAGRVTPSILISISTIGFYAGEFMRLEPTRSI